MSYNSSIIESDCDEVGGAGGEDLMSPSVVGTYMWQSTMANTLNTEPEKMEWIISIKEISEQESFNKGVESQKK